MDAAARPSPGPVPPPPATIADVARLAGVAKTTVSYALNDSGFVSDERRARILAAVEELGYRPNPNARALRRQAIASVGVVCADLSQGSVARTVNGIRTASAARGLTVVLIEPGAASEHVTADSAVVDGLIVFSRPPLRRDGLPATSRVPVVEISEVATDTTVSPEDRGADALRQLLTAVSPSLIALVPGTDERPVRHNRARRNSG